MLYRRIRDLREDRDLLQKDIAKLLNCSQVCYSRYESGKRDIPTDVLIKLADFYGVTTDYILGRTDKTENNVPVRDKEDNKK
ncbi:MAG: helix-turn-helix transcriptional regulator [Ruminococcaceae bacterium]|nr:helix-turn-helix transcriptional regulator [Oscillospiraceae bacterium]